MTAGEAAQAGALPTADLVDKPWAQFRSGAVTATVQRQPGIDGPAIALNFALHRVAAEHQRRSETLLLRRHRLSYSGFRVLYMVWLLEPVQARDLARFAGVSRQTTSTVLATLEGAGLIRRERSAGGDRRLVEVRLTEPGRGVVTEALRGLNELEREWFAALSATEQQSLVAMCDRILVRMRAGSAGARRETVGAAALRSEPTV